MPWCDTCDRFLNPGTLDEQGACPTCGRVLEDRSGGRGAPKVPWHFWLLLAALTLYLGWRLVEGIGWLVGQL